MMIKAEMFEDKALLLDDRGRVWQVLIGHDDQPEVSLLAEVAHDTIRSLMLPDLAKYIK